jgi:hypothetical protein
LARCHRQQSERDRRPHSEVIPSAFPIPTARSLPSPLSFGPKVTW